MINLLLCGCGGSMGQVVTQMCKESDEITIVAGFDASQKFNPDYPVFNDLFKITEKIDIILDFSHPNALDKILEYSKKKHIPAVIATTGLSEEQINKLTEHSNNTPVFFSYNMSLGINLISRLLKQSISAIANDFDIEIIEKHHNKKVDAPSGTAYLLANAINESLQEDYSFTFDRSKTISKRAKSEIGIHSLRGGTIAGEHSVILAGDDEIIEIKHTALSKKIFATGALKAVKFLVNQPNGFYNVDNLL